MNSMKYCVNPNIYDLRNEGCSVLGYNVTDFMQVSEGRRAHKKRQPAVGGRCHCQNITPASRNVELFITQLLQINPLERVK